MKVSELLDKPEKWCQKWLAKNADGDSVYAEDPNACKWCLAGALQKCYWTVRNHAYEDATYRLRQVILDFRQKQSGRSDYITIEDWNDDPSRTFAEILAVVEEAGV